MGFAVSGFAVSEDLVAGVVAVGFASDLAGSAFAVVGFGVAGPAEESMTSASSILVGVLGRSDFGADLDVAAAGLASSGLADCAGLADASALSEGLSDAFTSSALVWSVFDEDLDVLGVRVDLLLVGFATVRSP
ncbi:hypothetical protein [Pseudaestuariivita sp.]|uniref:hypothetical protein n=1 Tax=Pseudaestuariivita sp. TaxID=2211669 RepID=UPI004059935E